MKRRKERNGFFRILDANWNRSKEALRVCEDISRFFLEDKPLTAQFKRIRHDLTAILMAFPISYRELLFSRDSVNDLGKNSSIADKKNPKWQDIMAANLKRAQEALRVLEESSKVIAPKKVNALSALRFRVYELEKKSFRKF